MAVIWAVHKPIACCIIITTNTKPSVNMKTFHHTLFFFTVVSILVLASSGCQKEKATKWRCVVPQWKCNVELLVDNAADLAYVTVDYADGYAPNPRILFRHGTTYKKNGSIFRRINPDTGATELPGFVIASLSYEYMELVAVDYREDDNDSTAYKTLYFFTRVF